MKKIAIVLCFVIIVGIFAACSDSSGSYNGKTESFSSADDAFEAMTGAAAEGDYGAALECYTNGAADADEKDINNWYFYSLAMKEHGENGCVGYPLDLIYNRVSEDFGPAQTAYGQLQEKVRILNGVYVLDEQYVYIIDGKLAVSDGTRLSGIVFCDSEIAVNDDVFSWVKRNSDGTHEIKYIIELTDTGIKLTSYEGNTDTSYEGDYSTVSAEFPELCY